MGSLGFLPRFISSRPTAAPRAELTSLSVLFGGPSVACSREGALAKHFLEGLHDIPGVVAYGDFDQPDRCAIVSLNVEGMGSADVSDILMNEFGIATRPGAHCAPLMHRALGTVEQGVVRFSFGWNNTDSDVNSALDAVRAIAC